MTFHKNWLLAIPILLMASACSMVAKTSTTKTSFNNAGVEQNPDYSNLFYWASHPAKYDMADSIPKTAQYKLPLQPEVDVFFVHPTTFTDENLGGIGSNASLTDTALNKKTDGSTILYQASVFNKVAHIYAPRYRQAHLQNYFYTNSADSLQALKAFLLAYSDVKQAFDYYLKHNNNGRPIIIASHSQGTTHTKWLLRDFFDGKPLQQQLVAAYLVGILVEPSWFTNLQACKTPTETACVCSWRTFKEGHVSSFVEKESFTAIVTNPITWDATKPIALRNENAGSILQNFNKKVLRVADAKVHKGVLWTRKPQFFGNFLLKTTNYHVGDYNLYYYNIQANAAERINAFLANKKSEMGNAK